ncbi:hypothetical protein K1719_014904 [Acacia pycnantha]|nr:hypothetical protein K1719_014904 [Acacia pycnantha]
MSGENDNKAKVGAAIAENGWTGENSSVFPLASPLSRSSTLALLVTLLPHSPTLKKPKAEDFFWKPMSTATPAFLGSILISSLPPRVGPVLINIKKETSGASILKPSYEVFPTENMEELVVQDATKFVLVDSPIHLNVIISYVRRTPLDLATVVLPLRVCEFFPRSKISNGERTVEELKIFDREPIDGLIRRKNTGGSFKCHFRSY